MNVLLVSPTSMTARDPGDACPSKFVRQGGLQLNRLPAPKRIGVLDEFRQQTYAGPVHPPARLIAGLLLIEPGVQVTRGFTDVQSPTGGTASIFEQRDVDVMDGASRAESRRVQAECGLLRRHQPVWRQLRHPNGLRRPRFPARDLSRQL